MKRAILAFAFLPLLAACAPTTSGPGTFTATGLFAVRTSGAGGVELYDMKLSDSNGALTGTMYNNRGTTDITGARSLTPSFPVTASFKAQYFNSTAPCANHEFAELIVLGSFTDANTYSGVGTVSTCIDSTRVLAEAGKGPFEMTRSR